MKKKKKQTRQSYCYYYYYNYYDTVSSRFRGRATYIVRGISPSTPVVSHARPSEAEGKSKIVNHRLDAKAKSHIGARYRKTRQTE